MDGRGPSNRSNFILYVVEMLVLHSRLSRFQKNWEDFKQNEESRKSHLLLLWSCPAKINTISSNFVLKVDEVSWAKLGLNWVRIIRFLRLTQ